MGPRSVDRQRCGDVAQTIRLEADAHSPMRMPRGLKRWLGEYAPMTGCQPYREADEGHNRRWVADRLARRIEFEHSPVRGVLECRCAVGCRLSLNAGLRIR